MVLANSSLQQWKNPEISVNKPVCVLSQPLDFLPFLRLSRLCKNSTGALYPASAAEISTSSQLCARLSAVCYSQELAGNQFKMFHIQTPPHNSWISPFSFPKAGNGAFNCFALSARDILCIANTLLCHSSLQLLLQDTHQCGSTPAPAVTSLLCSFTIPLPMPMTFPVQLHPESLRHCHPPRLSQACSKNHHLALLLLVSHPPACTLLLFCRLCHCSIPQRKATASAPQCHMLRIPFTCRSPDHDQPWIYHTPPP